MPIVHAQDSAANKREYVPILAKLTVGKVE